MAGTPFKMKGFSGFGNSPLKQKEVYPDAPSPKWSKESMAGRYNPHSGKNQPGITDVKIHQKLVKDYSEAKDRGPLSEFAQKSLAHHTSEIKRKNILKEGLKKFAPPKPTAAQKAKSKGTLKGGTSKLGKLSTKLKKLGTKAWSDYKRHSRWF